MICNITDFYIISLPSYIGKLNHLFWFYNMDLCFYNLPQSVPRNFVSHVESVTTSVMPSLFDVHLPIGIVTICCTTLLMVG